MKKTNREFTVKKSAGETDEDYESFIGVPSEIELVDMGQIEEEDLPFLITDKDTGRVYDTRR